MDIDPAWGGLNIDGSFSNGWKLDRKYVGFPDDYLYDMHLFNVLNFLEGYCND